MIFVIFLPQSVVLQRPASGEDRKNPRDPHRRKLFRENQGRLDIDSVATWHKNSISGRKLKIKKKAKYNKKKDNKIDRFNKEES